jgi:hypothetical protein
MKQHASHESKETDVLSRTSNGEPDEPPIEPATSDPRAPPARFDKLTLTFLMR